VTTVFPRQGQFAQDPNALASYPEADLTIERISDLLAYDLPALAAGNSSIARTTKVTP